MNVCTQKRVKLIFRSWRYVLIWNQQKGPFITNVHMKTNYLWKFICCVVKKRENNYLFLLLRVHPAGLMLWRPGHGNQWNELFAFDEKCWKIFIILYYMQCWVLITHKSLSHFLHINFRVWRVCIPEKYLSIFCVIYWDY